jgi:hypothetical protein
VIFQSNECREVGNFVGEFRGGLVKKLRGSGKNVEKRGKKVGKRGETNLSFR